MKIKKSTQAYLENKRFIFFEVGMIIALALALLAFEWSIEHQKIHIISDQDSSIPSDLLPPIINRNDFKQPPQPVIDFKIVENTKVIIDPIELLPVEAKPGDMIPFPLDVEKNVIDTIYDFVEIMPKFRGKHHNEFVNFVYEHIKYPPLAEQHGVDGIVYVRFIINENGNLVNAKIYKGVDPALDNEALRVVNLSEKWTPGIQNFKPVKVSFVFPVKFKIVKT